MKRFFMMACALAMAWSAMAGNDLRLWYNTPANNWNDALPLGNGRIATMVYGNPQNEEYQLNEETISKGSPYDNYNPEALQYLDEVRKLVFAGMSDSAQKVCDAHFISTKELGRGGAYQTAGSLHIDYTDHKNPINLCRELNISNATSLVSYKVKGVTYKEEAFTSLADQLLVIRLSASKKGKLNFDASFSYPDNLANISAKGNTLTMNGTTQDAAPAVPGGVNYLVKANIQSTDGKLTTNGTSLSVRGATSVIIYVAMATNFVNYKDISGSPQNRVDQYMQASGNFDTMLSRHTKLYKEQFERVKLNLGEDIFPQKTTEERIRDFHNVTDNYLVSLYYQFGRYLLICSSQPGCQPANLQGKWNAKLNPAWMSRYTVNINTEMNYWPAEPTALPEMTEPLFKMISELTEHGSITARKMYGCRGWVSHHNTDLWRMTGAVDHAYSGQWPMSGAWFCQHLWNHYLYNGDKSFLANAYDVMRGAAMFFVDFLTTDPRTGYKVVCPSVSPENAPNRKPRANVYAGITMDNELLADLFTNTAEAARVLGKDSAFADTLLTLRAQLSPLQVGKHGQLQEWFEDWDNPNDHHRHVSHLWALYPGTEISPYRSPEAFNGVKTSLIQRGDPSTGWSMGWKVCLWARCLDGNHAYKLIRNQLTLVPDTIEKGQGGGTYPNMFDAHPPFQIDGNFGCVAGITEMLLQSHDGFVNILPALPDAWANGEVSGLRTTGGFVIDHMAWKNGRITSLNIRSTIGGNLRLRIPQPLNDSRLLTANGENPNPLFSTYTMPCKTSSAADKNVDLRPTWLYDIETKPNEVIEII